MSDKRGIARLKFWSVILGLSALQACTQFPDIAGGTTTGAEFRSKIVAQYPVGSNAQELRKEIERQGAKVFSTSAPSGSHTTPRFKEEDSPATPLPKFGGAKILRADHQN